MSRTTERSVVERLDEAAQVVRTAWSQAPVLGIVAGSGLGALGELVEGAVRLPYAAIPWMPHPTVTGHAGELALGTLEGLPVAILSGRVHLYEGHAPADVVFGVRLLARVGAGAVLLTNAAGGIHSWLAPGTLVRIVDHINLMGRNPLSGPNLDELGPRFPDMTEAYDPLLGGLIERAAAEVGVHLERGVYAGMLGPSYETPAEIRMLRVLGAATVGMSTVPEVIALSHMGIRVGCISVVSNLAAGVSRAPLDHSEVKIVADAAGPDLLAIVRALAAALEREGLP